MPARQILSLYRSEINERFAISFSDVKVAECFQAEELPSDLTRVLASLDAFSRSF